VEALVVELRPAGPLRLHGSGDRSAWSPGPGAIPGEEPLLPRLETLVGMLADTAYRAGCTPSCGCKDWCSCSLAAAAHLLYGTGSASAALLGPLLVAETRENGEKKTRVYINVSTGLLDLDGLPAWAEAAKLLAMAWGALLPSHASRLAEEARNSLQELEEKSLYIPAWRLASRPTSVALDPQRKAASHGLIYSLARVDLRGGLEAALKAALSRQGVEARVERVRIVAVSLGWGPGHAPCTAEWASSLGPKSTPVYVRLARLEALNTPAKSPEEILSECTRETCIALTPAPIEPGGWAGYAIHPRPPGPPLEVYARAYGTTGPGFAKDKPRPSYWPGTLLKGYRDPGSMCSSCNTPRLQLVHTPTLELLNRVGEALTQP